LSFWYPFDEPLILASRSPRRSTMLSLAGIPFETSPSDIDEENGSGDPEALVLGHSMAKASAVAERLPGRIVLGADTLVMVRGEVLGKPSDRDGAVRMLSVLSGGWHEVYGGVALLGGSAPVSFCEVSRVRFRNLSEAEIEAYVDTGEPMDKAGAYGIQGYGSVLVDRIEGCFFNVMGLPLARTVLAIRGLRSGGAR
jgi:septum formation protein